MGKVVIFPNTRSISCLPTQTVVAEQAYLDLGHGIVHVVNNILHGVLELQLIEQFHAVVVDRDTGGLPQVPIYVMIAATNHSTTHRSTSITPAPLTTALFDTRLTVWGVTIPRMRGIREVRTSSRRPAPPHTRPRYVHMLMSAAPAPAGCPEHKIFRRNPLRSEARA
jgi:hypothetical protein